MRSNSPVSATLKEMEAGDGRDEEARSAKRHGGGGEEGQCFDLVAAVPTIVKGVFRNVFES